MSSDRQITLAVVLFPGFEPLDVIGPIEIFGMAPEINIYYVAEVAGSVKGAVGNVQLHAQFSFQDVVSGAVPVPAWLLVPGGFGTRTEVTNNQMLNFLRHVGPQVELCMSVCTGTSLLAASGLLDGRKATTNKRVFEWVITNSSNVEWIRAARWVQDGKFVTSSGVTAGMDMAVRVLKDMLGTERAEQAALHTEYLPSTDSTLDPFADPAFVPPV